MNEADDNVFANSHHLRDWLKTRGVQEDFAGTAAASLYPWGFDRPSTLEGIPADALVQQFGLSWPVALHVANKLKDSFQRSIFSHGLPRMGPILDATKLTSNPSIPTEEQHPRANVELGMFETLPDLELPYPITNIWNQVQKDGTLGGFSSEADVNSFVKMVIQDILESLKLRENVTIRGEVEIMRNRPDFMLILVNGHPIGTIDGKQPGQGAMTHPNILGEVYDQLMHLRSIFRITTPFSILSCYDSWRICWLNDDESTRVASLAFLPESSPYTTPVKEKQNAKHERKTSSPQPPSTPSRQRSIGHLQHIDTADSSGEDTIGQDDSPRTFCGTKVIHWNDRMLPTILASAIKKMMLSRQGDSPLVLRLAGETKSVWKRAPLYSTLNFDLCISRRVKNFLLWEDLGHGADGRAFLVSGGTKGAVGVLKFYVKDPEQSAWYEEKLWRDVYSHLPPVVATVRTVKVLGLTALLMPWFQVPERNNLTLLAVEKTMTEDFLRKGIRHNDVAWRNVGVYNDDGHTRAVLFDMLRVEFVNNEPENWVEVAVASLRQKLLSDN